MMRRFLIVPVTLALMAPAARATTWEIDPAHTSVQFAIRHMMVSNVRGVFDKVAGTAKGDAADPTKATLEVSIDTTSIDTRNAKRDEHLRSPDFLDTAKFPTMTFKAKKVEKAAEGHLKVTGDLALHGVTKEVVLDVEGPTPTVKDLMGTMRAGAHATTVLKRSDFGIVWNKTLETGGMALGDEIQVSIDVEATQKQD